MSDPRRPNDIWPFYESPEKNEGDASPASGWYGLLSTLFAVIGMLLRVKLASWLAVIFILPSIAVAKNKDMNVSRLLTAAMFPIMTLSMNYSGPRARAAARHGAEP